MACEVRLTWHDTLELAAAFAGLTRVRSRFLPFGDPPAWPKGQASTSEASGLERTTALARAGLYNFLAVNLAEPPSASFTQQLLQSRGLSLLADKGLGGEELRRLADPGSPADHADDLARAYTQLLVRPGPNSAPPLASEYLGEEAGPLHPLSLGTVAEAVEAAYREAGVIVSGAGPYPPHHLAIELQFMHHCAAREAAAWGENSTAEADLWQHRQVSFLTAHLLPWVRFFCDRVGARGGHPWFRALAALTASFLAADARDLAAGHPVPSSAAHSSSGVGQATQQMLTRPGLRAG